MSFAAPSGSGVSRGWIQEREKRTVAHVVPDRVADEVAVLVVQLHAVLEALRHVPDVVADDPRLVVDLLQEGLGLGSRRRGRAGDETRQGRGEECGGPHRVGEAIVNVFEV